MLMRTFSLFILSLLFFNGLANSKSLDETPSFVLPKEISFKRDVMPVFMKAGCNAGDCHGSSRGQDGFMLSLFGYDPEGDYYRLTQEEIGRRVNLVKPDKSLLLMKATGSVSHTGGTLFAEDSESYAILHQWIKQGAKKDEEVAVAKSIRFDRTFHKFERPGLSIPAKVIATYDDGEERDVTRWSLFMTNNESVVQIDEDATIRTSKAGGANVFARFDKFSVGMEITVLPEGEFTWNQIEPNNYVDELVFEKLKDLRVLPSKLTSDEDFLRRVTLDLSGTIPTTEEYYSFMNDQDPNKRSKLIDRLLNKESFGELMAAKWGEWLRIYTDTNPGSGTAMKAGWNYYHWIREKMVENEDLATFTKELITGNGSNFSNPPSNYYTMIPQGKIDPVRLSEDTAQIFFGIRMQCAQCHNHPFDRWTMDDYYSWVSFFTGLRRKHGSEAREYYTYVDVDAEPAKHPIDDRLMPHKYLGGEKVSIVDDDARKILAQWMTLPDNRLFRENMANRIWAHFFGKGIVEPVDDVRISNPPSIPKLMSELGRRLGEVYDYDQKKLIRDICNSKTYQLAATLNESNKFDDRFFSHADLRRLRADVLFDALSQALEKKVNFRRSSSDRALVMFEGGRRDNYNSYFFETFGQARRESVCICEDRKEATLSQALHLINGQTIDMALQRNPTLIPRLIKEIDSPEKIIESLYIRTLSRLPSKNEAEGMLAHYLEAKDDRARQYALNDVLWSLLNSSEFSFNH